MDHSPVHGARTARDLGRYRCTAVDACAREGRCVSRQASVFEEQSIALSIEAPGPHCRFRVTCKQADGLGPRLQLTRLVPERSHHIYGHRHSGAGSCCSPSARVVGNRHGCPFPSSCVCACTADAAATANVWACGRGSPTQRWGGDGLASPCARGIFFAGSPAAFV
jgi:hypothetical protein